MNSLFVDECKQRPYLLVGYLVANHHHQKMRKQLRGFLLPGQRSLHFKAENRRRKRTILRFLLKTKCQLIVVKCQSRTDGKARYCSLGSLLSSKQSATFKNLTFELDETVRLKDHHFLKQQQPDFAWDHRKRHEEPLLWVADAVAWCVNRGGEWEKLVRPLIVETIDC
ncbi:MAG: hypothetical protein RLY22_434 [Actinomycetota bacterium]|jgi:hypothetical protein